MTTVTVRTYSRERKPHQPTRGEQNDEDETGHGLRLLRISISDKRICLPRIFPRLQTTPRRSHGIRVIGETKRIANMLEIVIQSGRMELPVVLLCLFTGIECGWHPDQSPASTIANPRVARPGVVVLEVGTVRDDLMAIGSELAFAYVGLAPEDCLEQHGLHPRRVHFLDVCG